MFDKWTETYADLYAQGIWVTKSGEQKALRDVDDKHLLNIGQYLIGYAERMVKQMRRDNDRAFLHATRTLHSEEALYTIENAWLAEEENPTTALDILSDHPIFEPLRAEFNRRGLHNEWGEIIYRWPKGENPW